MFGVSISTQLGLKMQLACVLVFATFVGLSSPSALASGTSDVVMFESCDDSVSESTAPQCSTDCTASGCGLPAQTADTLIESAQLPVWRVHFEQDRLNAPPDPYPP